MSRNEFHGQEGSDVGAEDSLTRPRGIFWTESSGLFSFSQFTDA
jgi:hypothetical protein